MDILRRQLAENSNSCDGILRRQLAKNWNRVRGILIRQLAENWNSWRGILRRQLAENSNSCGGTLRRQLAKNSYSCWGILTVEDTLLRTQTAELVFLGDSLLSTSASVRVAAASFQGVVGGRVKSRGFYEYWIPPRYSCPPPSSPASHLSIRAMKSPEAVKRRKL